MTKILKDALKKQKKSTRQAKLQISGSLGIPIGGQKLVEVPNRNSFVYVKLRDNQNEVIQAFNNKVAPSYGLPVIVERQHNRYVVLDVDTIRYQSDWTSFAPYLPRHGNTHSFDTENGGGGDIVWVHGRQFMPSLIIPSGTLGAPNVLMSGYSLKNVNGSWKFTGNTGTQNLTPYKPVTGTQAVMVLVYLDTVSGNPYLMVGSGSYFPSTLTGTAQVLPYVPSVTNPAHIPLSAIRLVTGTSAIGWNNIYDVRQYYYNITGVPTSVDIQDEGISLGSASSINFVGSPVSVTLAGGVARVFVTGSSGGVANLTGTSIGLPFKLALTNGDGFLTTSPALAWGITGTGGNRTFVDFGADVSSPSGRVFNAGWMGYKLFDNDFDIVGAGTGSGDRWVRIYDNLRATLMQPGSLQIPTLTNTFVWLNATGTFVTANNANQQTFITGSDFVMGVNGATDASFLTTVNNLANAIIAVDILGAFTNATVQATGTFSACPWKATLNSTTNALPWPDTGIASSLSIRISTAQPASGSLVATLVVNGVATSLVVTIPAGAGGGTSHTDSTHQVSITSADLIRWDLQNNATAASANVSGITMKLSKRSTA